MKKRKLLLVFVIFVIGFTIKSYAQAPQQFNYQGAARNSNGTPLANKSISLRISILNGSSDGSAQYSEVRNVTTNALGLYNIAIGSPGAASVTGSIAGVTWQNGSKFIKVEVDPNNGSNFNLAGTAQLLSVPYAMYAGNGGSSTPETVTVLKDNGDGTYTYTSEDKTITVINVTGSVKSNIQNILADNAVKVAIAQLVNQSAGNVSYDATNKTFTYKDPQGNTQNIDLAQVTKASQTVTTLTKNGNTSVYTYTNEVGATVDIDVIGDVKNNFSNIANDPAVKTALQQVAGTTTEVVKFNAGTNQFTYTDASGKPQTLDLGQLVKSNQTITTLTKDPATAIYTYTSEDGTKVNIDVVGDVKGKISDILNDPAAKTALQEVAGKTTEVVKYNAGTNQFTYTDASGNPQTVDLGKLTKDNETTTTITKDAATSIYTYTNEKGATVNIDVVGDVKGKISDILNDPAAKTALQDVAGKTTEVVKYNAGTNQFTYTDAIMRFSRATSHWLEHSKNK